MKSENKARSEEKQSGMDKPDLPDLADIVGENITAMIKMRKEKEREKSVQERIADSLTRFSGSMTFVWLHAIWFAGWIIFNTSGKSAFDPFPFSLLTLIVSLEAIFLSTFVLISQNHASGIADRRSDLDLQINLLSEHEITRILALTDAIADHLGIEMEKRGDSEELKKDIDAGRLLDEIETRETDENSETPRQKG